MNKLGKVFERFSSVVNQVFSLDFVSTASNESPIDLGMVELDCCIPEQRRFNNMLIKVGSQPVHLPNWVDNVIAKWVDDCLCISKYVCDDLGQRYVYLTLDNQPVIAGDTQRQDGWHLDGLQGDEVPDKLNNCFQFLWVSNTPTEFCTQSFSAEGIDISRHNVFESLGRQVSDNNCFKINSMHTYLMHCYQLHRATEAVDNTDRLFLRLYVSHCPVTSVNATINDEIEYPFVPHSTTGLIPEHLV